MKGGVSIGLILCMLDGIMYCTLEVWPHSAGRSMPAGFCGEGQTGTLVTSQASDCLSLAGVLGDYAEMKEMIL